MRTVTGVWRWRRNPLCRRTDLVEAWVALAALACLLLLAPAAGALAGLRVDRTLQAAVREQAADRTLVHAVVVRPLAAPPPGGVSTDAAALRQSPAPPQVLAAWTAPDGTRHSGTLAADERAEPLRTGQDVPLWTDGHGRIVPRPLDSGTAVAHAALAGIAAAAVVAALAETLRRLVVRRLTHRRYAQLDRAWASVGPDWGRTGAGS
ncbi:hypothetical protein [Streptomyces sp. NRRL S-87]|uniref:Rv1733c family protein n=1 Tax=Streptomyces sp. NRRL S-87 TaxID=1463920 RepID=UPI0004C26DF2|nr:hypothetical protein [Streptomyces sp. NRRL S-87]